MSDINALAKCQLELEKDFQTILEIIKKQAKKIECLEKKFIR